jgi:hypothetical protein
LLLTYTVIILANSSSVIRWIDILQTGAGREGTPGGKRRMSKGKKAKTVCAGDVEVAQ